MLLERVISLEAGDEQLISFIRSVNDPMQSKEMITLIYRYTRMIKIKAAKMSSFDIEREDLQQEGYIALLDAVKTFDPMKGSFYSFASACIDNRMKNAAAKARGKLEKADDYDFEQIIDDRSSIDDHVIVKEYDIELKNKLSKLLTEKEHNVLKLYLEGYSYKQIAEKLGVSVKSVDNSLLRARNKLKDVL